MARTYKLISADNHLEIAPERWTGRVPARYRDRAPRLVRLADGGDGIVVENRALYVLGLAVTGKPYQEHQIHGITYEGSPGCGTPEQRITEQDADGVDAEVLFTSAGNGGFWRGIRDDDAFKAVIHAYNEFLVEEYCVVDRDRLLGMGIIPSTSVDDSIAEMEYCVRSGLKGVALNSFPSGKTWPTAEDDRFWAAALDMNMPLTVHIGFIGRDGPVFKYTKEPLEVAFGADPVRVLTRFGVGAMQAPIQLMMFGVFDRFPKLRLYIAETMVGWIPYQLEQLDDIYERIRYWAGREYDLAPVKRRPSDYIRQHTIWGFLHDPFGVKVCREVGLDCAMWGSDFSHSASDWPNSRELLDEMFAGHPPEDRQKLTCANAVEYFHLDHVPA